MKLEISTPESIKTILNILHSAEGKPRFVGGVVRDAIIGITNSDIDLITILEPNIVTDLLTHHGVFVKDTGIKHGTVTAFLDDDHTQITTLRIDQDCDGRHANAKFTDDFETDAKRRDFTINAMSYCPFEHKLYDYTNGYNDLMARRVVFIGDPAQRIEEDYLRILRFFRFSDKFAWQIDQVSLKACIDLRAGLVNLSKERVLMEMTKIMESPICHKILQIMIENQILKEVMPVTLSVNLLAEINETHNIPLHIPLRFAALMHNNEPKKLLDALYKMHFSIKDADKIAGLVAFRAANPNLHKAPLKHVQNVLFTLWVDNVYNDSYMLISECWKRDDFNILHNRLNTSPPKFPVNGNDITNLGIKGAAIKTTINTLKAIWIESEFRLDKDKLLRMINA